MPMCIFCRSTTNPFNTREHILPESLGGGDWAILPSGLFCDRCQNRFGSEIEQQALSDYPFSFLRVFLGIPTKRGKFPWLTSWEGVISASAQPGQVGYEPSALFEKATQNRQKTVMRLLAHPIKPDMICRFLLKMGLEVIACNDRSAAFDKKLDPARRYALTGAKSGPWWYLQREDLSEANRYIKDGATPKEWSDTTILEAFTIDGDAEVFHLRLLYLDMFAPLDPRIHPDFHDLPEPEYRLFNV